MSPFGPTAPPVGRLLKHWRQVPAQEPAHAVSLEADVSPRHLGFIEVGRAKPAESMVLTLAKVLDVPLRERNGLLLAAGFAPMYHETGLSEPAMAQARRALDSILRQQEPFPAVVMDWYWNILLTNDAAPRFFGLFIDLAAEPAPANVLRLMFDPAKLRPFVQNWEAVAEALIHRVHREAVGGAPDSRTAALLKELLSYPGVPRALAGTGPHGGVDAVLTRGVPHPRPGNAVLLYGDDAGNTSGHYAAGDPHRVFLSGRSVH